MVEEFTCDSERHLGPLHYRFRDGMAKECNYNEEDRGENGENEDCRREYEEKGIGGNSGRNNGTHRRPATERTEGGLRDPN
jgi:hypothetical protein